MCGFAGILNTTCGMGHEELEANARRMAETLSHRGPNDAGAWADPKAGIALGFRRLAIVDLTPEGHQPMTSASGRYVVAFNGEIYNYRALRRELERETNSSVAFRGHSDTEVLLAAVERWGLEDAIGRSVGMFALALWDRRERRLHLVRDRIGEKPLYYGWSGETFVFGSELKSLRAFPGFRGEVCRESLALYLRYNYIPNPASIYKGIFKLPPGTIVTINPAVHSSDPTPVAYWSARAVAEAGESSPFSGSRTDAADCLDGLLRDSIRDQMVADVPVGAFLSGGIDSSTVVALMQAQCQRPVRTFTIGFHEDGYNEAIHAKAIAKHLGTEHTELYVTSDEARQVIPNLPALYDEPFADSSQIPTFLVSQLARRDVTVSLSGDGGDELFCGYPRYFMGKKLWNRLGWSPRAARRLTAAGLTTISPRGWDRAFDLARPITPQRLRLARAGDRLHKLASILDSKDAESMYQLILVNWRGSESVVRGELRPANGVARGPSRAELRDFTHTMMYIDTVGYLPDDILTKLDRASMGVSLESRAPLLDHRIVEFAWRLPLSFKVREGKGKWLLRQVLNKYVPHSLIDRPKMGFGVPIDEWLRGPLRAWAEDLLGERRLLDEGFFDPKPVREKWQEHLTGHRNWQSHLWGVLMFQAWLAAQ